MAAAQNVRSGSIPGPTNDPDLWSRPPRSRPFQGSWSRPLIQTFGMIKYMGELMSAIIYPAKQATNSLLSSQAAKLHALLRQSSSQAVKQSSSQAVKQSSSQAVKQSSSQAVKQSSSQAVKQQLLHIQAVKQPSCPLAASWPCRPFAC